MFNVDNKTRALTARLYQDLKAEGWTSDRFRECIAEKGVTDPEQLALYRNAFWLIYQDEDEENTYDELTMEEYNVHRKAMTAIDHGWTSADREAYEADTAKHSRHPTAVQVDLDAMFAEMARIEAYLGR